MEFFMKKFFSTMIMIVMLLVCCLSFSACGEELVNVEVKFMVGSEEKTIEFVLYKHLAPESVAQFEDLAEDGYYNDLIMYKTNVQGSAIAIGQYKATADGIAYNEAYDKVATINGEFAKGGTAGSNLHANKGAICVWRWWEESRGGLSASGYETGSLGAIMLPLSSSFNDNTNDGATLIAVMGHVADADKAEYEKLKNFTGIPIVKLIHFAIPLLKKKYRYKEEEKGSNEN
jgi:cyclophilin family peptidyl-prolyl cis-trans isomerase